MKIVNWKLSEIVYPRQRLLMFECKHKKIPYTHTFINFWHNCLQTYRHLLTKNSTPFVSVECEPLVTV